MSRDPLYRHESEVTEADRICQLIQVAAMLSTLHEKRETKHNRLYD